MPLPGTFFVLALHGTTPACEEWTATPTTLVHADLVVDAHLDHDKLVYEGMRRGDSSTACTTQLPVSDTADGLDVDGAVWFRTKAACQAALRRHAHVAMRWPCDVDDGPEPPPAPATKRRFDDILAYGGILYAEGACNRVRFEATATTATRIQGELSYRIPGGREAYDYEGKRGDRELTLLGPGATMDDGSAWALGCGDEISVGYHADHVDVTGALYFDQASCKAATERAQYRESWLPGNAQEAAFGRVPLAGGC